MAENCEAFFLIFIVVAIPADHPEGCLAVDEVQAGVWDDDFVGLQLEVALSERLALTIPPLQMTL